MDRKIRCQGAVVQNDRILLVKHLNLRLGTAYWWLPGGGLEEGETFEECTMREIREETHLDTRIERLILDEEDPERRYTYERFITYLCTPVGGELYPGNEAGSQTHAIFELGWYSLWDESAWEMGLYGEHIYQLLKSIQGKLGQENFLWAQQHFQAGGVNYPRHPSGAGSLEG